MADRVPARLTAADRPALSAAEGRSFGLTLGGAFLALALVAGWRGKPTVLAALLAVAGALVASAIVAPTSLGPVQRGWMRMALAMSRVTTPLFLGAVYFLVVTPTGLLRRTFGRSPIAGPPAGASGWAPHERGRSDLQRQF